MKLSNCASFMFTGGKDGHLMVFDVKDRESSRARRDKDMLSMEYSDEVLTLDGQIDELNGRKAQLVVENVNL